MVDVVGGGSDNSTMIVVIMSMGVCLSLIIGGVIGWQKGWFDDLFSGDDEYPPGDSPTDPPSDEPTDAPVDEPTPPGETSPPPSGPSGPPSGPSGPPSSPSGCGKRNAYQESVRSKYTFLTSSKDDSKKKSNDACCDWCKDYSRCTAFWRTGGECKLYRVKVPADTPNNPPPNSPPSGCNALEGTWTINNPGNKTQVQIEKVSGECGKYFVKRKQDGWYMAAGADNKLQYNSITKSTPSRKAKIRIVISPLDPTNRHTYWYYTSRGKEQIELFWMIKG
jgi:hypothetical protein